MDAKKKFEKPEMEEIKIESQVTVLTGSCTCDGVTY